MSITAMRQALEALERSVATCFDQYAHRTVMSQPDHFINQAITSLRQAIEQAEKQDGVCQHCAGKGCVACDAREQEPVAWMHKQGNYEEPSFRQLDDWEIGSGWTQYPLYTHPQPKAEQEPTRSQKMRDLGFTRRIKGWDSDADTWQEPIAWAMLHDNGAFIDAICPEEHERLEGEYKHPVYTHPQPKAIINNYPEKDNWVGLTDEEIDTVCILLGMAQLSPREVARAIEAKLKEKNI